MTRASNRVRCLGTLSVAVVVSISTLAATAWSADNDVVLRRLGDCTFESVNGRTQCVEVAPDTAGFEALSRDLGLALSPKGMAPAETLGQAGFDFGFDLVFNVVDSSQDYWQLAVEDMDPSNLLVVSQIHLRKGLPFSFELGAVLSHLFNSSMWGLGVELAWSLHEDFLWPVPDLQVRGFVSNVVGSADLNLTMAGFDVVLGVPIGVSNVYSLTPYVGYNFTSVFSSSRLLDASPEDDTPPVEGSGGAPSVKPEFVFDDTRAAYSRFVGGLRFRYAVLNVTTEVNISTDVQSYSVHFGLDF